LPARGSGGEQGQWHPGIGEDKFPRGRVEKGVQGAAETATDGSLHQALVQPGKNLRGVRSGLVNPAHGSDHERAVHGRRQALADHVAKVDADETVR